MKNTKHQTPNTPEPLSTKLQYLARLQGRFKNGARTAMSACFFRSSPGLNPPWVRQARFGVYVLVFLWCLVFEVWSLVLLWRLEFGIWTFARL
jgi:hypothetical protein